MKLIVGLGNPGTKYELTRHNIGFRTVDRLINTVHAKPLESTRWFRLFDGSIDDERILFLYPLMYMNRSGDAVNEIAIQYGIEPQNIIVIYDDFNLPLGSIRIRAGGSAGGHNGLTSIIETMGTKEIPRVRLGIYNETSFLRYSDAADFVLSAFEPEEEHEVTTMITKAHDALLMIVKEGIPKAMNSFNKVADGKNSTNSNNTET